MKLNIIKFLLVSTIMVSSSCTAYLDIVPDNTLTLEDIFLVKEEAYNALAKVYSYMPHDEHINLSLWFLGDEWITPASYENTTTSYRSVRIMRGLQSVSNPILGTWSGTDGGQPLYEGIRASHVFLENIDKVQDMSDSEKLDWKAQIKFLQAYYSFLLVQKYGPIVIADKLISPDALSDELFQRRSNIDDCFDFILRVMNEAIPDLKERASSLEYGRIDRVGAMAIKARVLFFRASPFFNGNSEFYSNFLDHNKQPFFPKEYKKEKWKDAIDAIEEAIQIAVRNGAGLYTFDKAPYTYDREDFEIQPERMQTLYDLRMLFCDPWNKELLWGMSNIKAPSTGLEYVIAASAAIMLPSGYGEGITYNAIGSYNWSGASYTMLERFYTKNGIPISEDKTFPRNSMYDVMTVPGAEDIEYEDYRGYMQPGAQTINLYLNREPRFYANMGITGGYWRGHNVRINTVFYSGTDGGYTGNNNYILTGIGVQKLIHPESISGHQYRIVRTPYTIIRMADLYLMKAEALNEYLDDENSVPSQDIYDAVNIVRERAGIPKIETVWSNSALVRTVNKHKTKAGMREIILHERAVEFAFEGNRYWDMFRHKKAHNEFSSPVMGWNHLGLDAETFFVLEPKQYRKFTVRDYLWPVGLDELNTNSNLIQNPGW
jgi:hypothetical protein